MCHEMKVALKSEKNTVRESHRRPMAYHHIIIIFISVRVFFALAGNCAAVPK